MKRENQNQKIKDTAADVEILIHFSGCFPDKTIDVCFTACETSVAPLGCVIEDNKPLFISEMLKISTTERLNC
jgi:topoisomerase-4 subunit A